ncbi:MAG: hypothetical protein AAFX94_22970, partial [Myxococcota bacterium]
MDAKTAPARERRRPPRPEALLAVLYRLEDGPHIELTIARWLEDADLFAANITRDPTGAMAINLTAPGIERMAAARPDGEHGAMLPGRADFRSLGRGEIDRHGAGG